MRGLFLDGCSTGIDCVRVHRAPRESTSESAVLFGLSYRCVLKKPIKPSSQPAIPHPQCRLGTLDYMAPEVLRCMNKNEPDENKVRALFFGRCCFR